MTRLLDGRVALVTGAATGIGKAIAADLARHGAKLVLADPGTSIDGMGADPIRVKEAAGEIGPDAAPFADSIASPSAAASAVALAVKRFGGLDIVVNNAAIRRDAPIFAMEPRDWEAVIQTNLSAASYVTAVAARVLRENAVTGRRGDPYRWGRIVNIVSTAGLYGDHGQAAEAGAKAGLFGLTRATALDLADSGVTVNAVAPFAATRATAADEARATTPGAHHVASFVSFLCGPDAQGISGQLFGVRGRELVLFAQPRPVARIVARGGDWTKEDLAAAIAHAFAPSFADLSTDREAFD